MSHPGKVVTLTAPLTVTPTAWAEATIVWEGTTRWDSTSAWETDTKSSAVLPCWRPKESSHSAPSLMARHMCEHIACKRMPSLTKRTLLVLCLNILRSLLVARRAFTKPLGLKRRSGCKDRSLSVQGRTATACRQADVPSKHATEVVWRGVGWDKEGGEREEIREEEGK